jgi:hypothetical protein
VRLVRAVAPARSEDPARQVLSFVVLSWAEGTLALVATDSHRLHVGYPSPALVAALAVPKGATWTFDAEYVARLPRKPPADNALSLTLFELPAGVAFPPYAQVLDPTTETEDGVTVCLNAAYLADIAAAQKALQVASAVMTPPSDALGTVAFRLYDAGRLVFHAVVLPMRRART